MNVEGEEFCTFLDMYNKISFNLFFGFFKSTYYIKILNLILMVLMVLKQKESV